MVQGMTRAIWGTGVKVFALAGLALTLSGCLMAAPSAFQLATYALDGASYVATGKSATDHVISTVADKDCAMTRALKGDDICVEKPDTVVLMPDGTRPANAMDVGGSVKSASEDQTFQAFSAANDQSVAKDQDEVFDLNAPAQAAKPVQVAFARKAGADHMPAIRAVPVVPVEDAPLAAVGEQVESVTPTVQQPIQAPAPRYETGLYDEDEVLSDADIARLDQEMQATPTPATPKL